MSHASLRIAPDEHGRHLWAVAAEIFDARSRTWSPDITYVHARDLQSAHFEYRRAHAGEILRIIAAGPPIGFFTRDGRVLKG